MIFLFVFVCDCNLNPNSFLLLFRQHVDCVILDDGGFLLMSNRDDYIPEVGVG